ncbi:hypothetical protein BGZ58_000085 [Dissophora ornata]|nr:hypothetical protein BGZ58_000085 [Dissophora ornata]
MQQGRCRAKNYALNLLYVYSVDSPAKLFDESDNHVSPCKTVDHCGMNRDGGGYDAHSQLAPSLEPNVSSPHAREEQEEGEEEEEEKEEEESITLDVLLSEIQRLTAHEFGSQWKSAPYPSVLEPLYQRLCDYHVCLKSARKRAGDQPRSNSTHVSPMVNMPDKFERSLASSPVPPPAPFAPQESTLLKPITNNNNDMAPNTQPTEATTPASQGGSPKNIDTLKEKVTDLEKQLAQSRKAHHGLLREHILSITATTATIASASASTTMYTAPATKVASLTQNDALAIQTILSSIPTAAEPSNSTTKGRKKKFSLKDTREILSQSQISLQEALQTTKEHLHLRDNATKTNVSQSDVWGSNASLISLKDHPNLLADATTRLLRAETELGLLKLVMAQNQREILGLEDEVFRKQTELCHHRKVFDNILELNRLEYETQVWEDQVQIKELEAKVKNTEPDKESVSETIRTLEPEVHELQKRLNEKRGDYELNDTNMTDRVQDLEQVITQLRMELETTKANLQKAMEGDDETVVEHLEKDHEKKTVTLRSNLAQVQKVNKRLDKELSTLAVKIVRAETLNDELAGQAEKDRAEIKDLMRQAESLQVQLESAKKSSSSSSSSSSPPPTTMKEGGSQAAMKENIIALEIQIEELSTSLRLKELSLEQAHEETERLTLQLEQDLALQREAHAKEMAAFAEEKKIQAQRERACQSTSVTLFQNMVGKLQTELSETQEKLRDTTICWGHTKEQLQKCEQSYRRRKKDLEETTKHLHEVEETVMKLGDAIGMLETEKETNLQLVRALEERDRELGDLEYRLRVLEEERE